MRRNRRDLSYMACLGEGVLDVHALEFPVGHEHRNPVLFEEVVVFIRVQCFRSFLLWFDRSML